MFKNLILVSLLNIGKLLLQSSIAIVIALFTTPERFGLIGFSLPMMTFAMLVGTAGIAPAIIRQPDLTARELGAALTLAFTLSACLATAIGIGASSVERAANLPGLSAILSALGIVIVPANVAETLRAAMERRLHYQPLVKIELIALAIGATAAVLAALAGAGIWALVLYHLTLQIARVCGMAAILKGQIALNLGWRAIRPMTAFGGFALTANLCNFAARNTDNLLIGFTFGARAIGLYGIAYQLMTLPLLAIAWPASNLLLATLKRVPPGDDAAFARTVRDLMTFTAAIALPVAAWLTFAFPWLADRSLPPRWHEIAPLLSMLAPAGALQALAAFTGAVLLARDRPRLSLAVSVFNCVLVVGGFVVGVRFGFRAFVLIYVIVTSLVSLGQIILLAAVAGIGLRAGLRCLVPAALGAGATAGGFLSLRWLGTTWPPWVAMNGAAVTGLGLLYARCYPRLIDAMASMLRTRVRPPITG